MGIVSPGPAGPHSWADNRPQTHPDVGLLASPLHCHPYSILPLKSYQGFNPGPLMPFVLEPPTPAQEPPRGLLTASFSDLAHSSSPHTISSLSLHYFR